MQMCQLKCEFLIHWLTSIKVIKDKNLKIGQLSPLIEELIIVLLILILCILNIFE